MMADQTPSHQIVLRLAADLRVIAAEIQRLTGLPSQWKGQVEIIPEPDRAFGGKTFTCLIRVRADVAQSDRRWLTLLHEAFHSFSVERNPDASLAYSGYEEGVVEQMQRLFRSHLLESVGVTLEPAALVDSDANSAYTDYANALEAMRRALSAEPEAFYIALLSTPLEQRWARLREQAQQTSVWKNAGFRKQWRAWERTLRGS